MIPCALMPEEIDLDAYICGGYFLTKRISRPSAVSRLVPETRLLMPYVARDLKATEAETAIWEPWLVEQYGTGEPLP